MHSHTCPNCGCAWRHGDDLAGIKAAHTCPSCGSTQWQKDVIFMPRATGLGGYADSPPPSFFGWRLRNGGQPEGGQYHNFLACHSDPYDSTAHLPSSPAVIAGAPQNRSVYRSPGEPDPKANGSGKANIVRTRHPQYHGHLGASFDGGPVRNPCGFPFRAYGSPIHSIWPFAGGSGPGATATVPQPQPCYIPRPSPWVENWYAPPVSPAPAPTVAVGAACYLPSQGLSIAQQSTASTAPASFLSCETIIPGVSNLLVLAGGALAVFLIARSR